MSRYTLTAGVALFAMFFGSGNLIFPLEVGIKAGGHYAYALIGLLITAVLIPALGLISVIVASPDGTTKSYFDHINPKLSLLLMFSMLCLMGPFGVGARCLLVGVGGLKLLVPALSSHQYLLFLLNIAFCALVYFLLNMRTSIVDTLGKKLTPWLIASIGVLVVIGLWRGQIQFTSSANHTENFWMGIVEGYQTMDLLAAFFFAGAAYEYVKKHTKNTQDDKTTFLATFLASGIGFGLLALTYTGLAGVGARYVHILETAQPDTRLAVLADTVVGFGSAFIVSMMIFFACLTTLCILTELSADFLKTQLTCSKISKQWAIFIILCITLLVSSFGFYQVAYLIKTSLAFFYPALIVYALLRLIEKWIHISFAKVGFWLTFTLSIIVHFAGSLSLN